VLTWSNPAAQQAATRKDSPPSGRAGSVAQGARGAVQGDDGWNGKPARADCRRPWGWAREEGV